MSADPRCYPLVLLNREQVTAMLASVVDGAGIHEIVGSFFRYGRRYGPEFREQFEYGYRRAGGELSIDWWRTARLLDGTRLIAILNEARFLPTVFAECEALLEALLVDYTALANDD